MKKHLFLFALIFMTGLAANAAETAASILTSSANKVRAAKSLAVSYTITADGNTQKGIMTIAGDKFSISSPQMVSWYDGKTQWTYSSHTGEVNITTPTADELQQINPFAIIKTFSNNYSSQLLPSQAGYKKVKLTAVSTKSDIRSVTMTISAKTLYPTQIDMTMGNKQNVVIKILAVEEGPILPMSEFRFDPKKYPGVQIVDLR